MPLTTDSEHTSGTNAPANSDNHSDPHSPTSGDGHSGYDVVTSAASPKLHERPDNWNRFLLFNAAIPIGLILVGIAIVIAFGEAEATPLPPPDDSRAAVLERLKETQVEQIRSLEQTNEQLELVIDGVVVPYREAELSAEVSGQIVSKHDRCETGVFVNKGDLLMTIDDQDYQLELERLVNLLEQESGSLAEIDQEELNTNESLKLAKQDVVLRTKEVDRQTTLKDKTFASATEVERADAALLQSKQQLVSFESLLKLLEARRARLTASKKLVEKQIELAELNIRRCQVNAPISGVIVSEQADVNTFVNRGTPLVTIEDTSKVEVAANMRMDQLHWVLDQDMVTDRPGYELPETNAIVEYEVAGRRGAVRRWNGRLVSYDGIGIDPQTRTVPVRLLVDAPTMPANAAINQDPSMSETSNGDQSEAASDAASDSAESLGAEIVGDGSQAKPRSKPVQRTNALVRGMYVRVRLMLHPNSDLVVIPGNALRPGNRVWKFSPDDSVVDEIIAEIEAKKAEEAKKAAEANEGTDNPKAVTPPVVESSPKEDDDSEAEKDAPTFDPEKWSAGRVTFSKSVYPIESLRVGLESPAESGDGTPTRRRRFWVCEAPHGDLKAGDYIVVSPLDSVPEEGVPARAEITQ